MEAFNKENFEGLLLVIVALRDVLLPFAGVIAAVSVIYLIAKDGLEVFYEEKYTLKKFFNVLKKAFVSTAMGLLLFYMFPQILNLEYILFKGLTEKVHKLDLESIFSDNGRSNSIADHLIREGYLAPELREAFMNASLGKKQTIIFKYKLDRGNAKRFESSANQSYDTGSRGFGVANVTSGAQTERTKAGITQILQNAEEPNLWDMLTTYPTTMIIYYGLAYLLGIILAIVVIFIEALFTVLFQLFAFFGLIGFIFGIFPEFRDRYFAFIKTFGSLLLWPIVVFAIEFFVQFTSFNSSMNLSNDSTMNMSMLITPFVTLILYSGYGMFLYMIIGSEGGAGMVRSAVNMATRLVPYAGAAAGYMQSMGTQTGMSKQLGQWLYGAGGFSGTKVGSGIQKFKDYMLPQAPKSASEQILEEVQNLKSGSNL